VPAVAAALARAARKRIVHRGLGIFLAANELTWYGYLIYHSSVSFPDGLPLHLCNLTQWLTVLTCWRPTRWAAELAYFAGTGGALMAILTPDLWAPTLSYETAQFFVSHDGIVIAIGTLVFSGMVKLNRRSVWRAFGLVNVYALCIGLFNAAFDANYMYLCGKPPNPSVLDYLGPWPWYIVGGELIAFCIFAILALPFRRVE
jgi:hypothetical integral membrane protein (TIGR02206 family)